MQGPGGWTATGQEYRHAPYSRPGSARPTPGMPGTCATAARRIPGNPPSPESPLRLGHTCNHRSPDPVTPPGLTTTPVGTHAALRFGPIGMAACMLPPMSTAVDFARSWIEGIALENDNSLPVHTFRRTACYQQATLSDACAQHSAQGPSTTVHDRPWMSMHDVAPPLNSLNRLTHRVAKAPAGTAESQWSPLLP